MILVRASLQHAGRQLVCLCPTTALTLSCVDAGGIYAELPASVPSDDLADVLLLDRSPTGERSLEAVLLKLFASGRHAFRTDVALAGKVHDKVLLLDNPPRKSVSAAAAVSAAAVRKKCALPLN